MALFLEKFTKVVSTNYFHEDQAIQQAASELLKKARQLIDSYGEANTYNSDQSVFSYIMTSSLTLSEEDKKQPYVEFLQFQLLSIHIQFSLILVQIGNYYRQNIYAYKNQKVSLGRV